MTQDEAHDYVKALREKYPNPQAVTPLPEPETYCVLGALCLNTGKPFDERRVAFPSAFTAARCLRKLNPDLDRDTSIDLARDVYMQNDDGKFDEAWRNLEYALQYKDPRE